MNTLGIEAELAQRHRYKPLEPSLSEKYRRLFIDNIPQGLHLRGSDEPIFTINGTLISCGYRRIVVGDYGAFIEFKKASNAVVVKRGQEYRLYDNRYSKNIKYYWLTINDGSDVKIYRQKKKVSYADYVPGLYYVSVHEVKTRHDIALGACFAPSETRKTEE